MKIAILAPIAHKTPPDTYGPWELVASMVAEGMAKLGHEVTLFASGDSQTAGRLEAVVPSGIEGWKTENKYVKFEVLRYEHIANCFEKADRFDIIHSHFNYGPLAFCRLVKTPLVTTVHSGKVEFAWQPMLEFYKKYNDYSHYVSISDAARHEELRYTATVYNGINTEDFEFGDKPEDYLLFLGRIDADKGAAEAIEVAKKTGRKLVIAGVINDKSYFDSRIAPEIDGTHAEYIGPVGGKNKSDVIKNAFAMLHLVNFDEPFGLTVVESQAGGTPVVAINRGALPETVENGVTGFLVEDAEQAVKAVQKVTSLDRSACRKRVEDRFSREKMVQEYERVYKQILGK